MECPNGVSKNVLGWFFPSFKGISGRPQSPGSSWVLILPGEIVSVAVLPLFYRHFLLTSNCRFLGSYLSQEQLVSWSLSPSFRGMFRRPEITGFSWVTISQARRDRSYQQRIQQRIFLIQGAPNIHMVPLPLGPEGLTPATTNSAVCHAGSIRGTQNPRYRSKVKSPSSSTSLTVSSRSSAQGQNKGFV